MSSPIAIPVSAITPAPGMVLVTLLVGMSQADLGDFRLIPAFIEPGQPAIAGDQVEVDRDTAARWVEAGAAIVPV